MNFCFITLLETPFFFLLKWIILLFYCKSKGKKEAALHEENVLSNEEPAQEEVPQVPCVSGNLLCEQIR